MKSTNLALIGIVVGILGGCAGELENPERFAGLLGNGDGGVAGSGNFEPVPECVTAVIATSCGSSGCHAAGSPQIDLVSPGLTERLLDQPSPTDLCKDRIFIASDGEPSLLLTKLEKPAPCGSTMPLVGSLTDTQRMCLTDWVVDLGGVAPAGSE